MDHFKPRFATSSEAYEAAKTGVKTAEDWQAFRKAWFDQGSWPRLPPAGLAAAGAAIAAKLAGLPQDAWWPVVWTIGLAAEDRYEYFRTVADFTSRFGAAPPMQPGNGWALECPYCQIATRLPREPHCPVCSRALILRWSGTR